jgi:hypothetical protein
MTNTSLQRDHTPRSIVQKNRSREWSARRGPFSFENRNLLTKGEDLKSGIGSACGGTRNHRDTGEDAFDHESPVPGKAGRSRHPEAGRQKLFISLVYRVLSTHNGSPSVHRRNFQSQTPVDRFEYESHFVRSLAARNADHGIYVRAGARAGVESAASRARSPVRHLSLTGRAFAIRQKTRAIPLY